MAEITMNDLKETYIKLLKDAPVYTNPTNGDKGKPVWFMKKKGEIAGKLYWWITPDAPMQFTTKSPYMIFKVNDDFDNPNAAWYFIKFDRALIDWNYSKPQLAAKNYANMTLWEKFTKSMEDWADNVVADAKSGLVTGLSIVAAVLITNFVIVPYFKFKVLKSTARELIKEAKR